MPPVAIALVSIRINPNFALRILAIQIPFFLTLTKLNESKFSSRYSYLNASTGFNLEP